MSTPTPDPSGLLRASLRGNAAFSTLSGLAFVAAGEAIGRALGLALPGLLVLVGANLLAFAAALLWVASRPLPPRGLVLTIVALDLGWVLLTAVLILADAFHRAGALAALGVANVVLVFAILQALGLRRQTAAALPA